MTYKKIILGIFVFILLVSTASAYVEFKEDWTGGIGSWGTGCLNGWHWTDAGQIVGNRWTGYGAGFGTSGINQTFATPINATKLIFNVEFVWDDVNIPRMGLGDDPTYESEYGTGIKSGYAFSFTDDPGIYIIEDDTTIYQAVCAGVVSDGAPYNFSFQRDYSTGKWDVYRNGTDVRTLPGCDDTQNADTGNKLSHEYFSITANEQIFYGTIQLCEDADCSTYIPPVLSYNSTNITSPYNNYYTSNSSFNVTFETNMDTSVNGNCSLFVNGTYVDYLKSTTGGTINSGNRNDGVWTYFLYCNDNGGNYTNSTLRTITIYNTTPTITSNLENNNTYWSNEIYINVNASDDFHLEYITINGSCNINYSNYSIDKNHNYFLNFNIQNCTLGQKYIDVTACNNLSKCATAQYLWNLMARLNVSVVAYLTNSNINNFSVYYNDTYMGSTLNNYFALDNLTAGKHKIEVRSGKFQTISDIIDISVPYSGYVFYVYTRNSVNWTFIDENTLDIVGEDIYMEFISDYATYNYTVSGGTAYTDLIYPADYEIRYYRNSTGYLQHYYFTMTNQTYYNLTLFVQNYTYDTTATIYDKTTLNELEGAIVYLMRYYPKYNQYKTVNMYKTGTSGEAPFKVQENGELYKFIVDYPFGTRRLETTGAYIFSPSVNLYIPLIDEFGEQFFKEQGIINSITYNSNTHSFDGSWTDTSMVSSEFCLTVKTYGFYETTTLNTTCSSSSSGSISLGFPTQNDTTYYATLTAKIDGEVVPIATGYYDYDLNTLNSGSLGIFLTIILIIIFALLSQLHVLTLLFSTIALAFAKLLGIIQMEWGLIITTIIGAIILTIIIEMRK